MMRYDEWKALKDVADAKICNINVKKRITRVEMSNPTRKDIFDDLSRRMGTITHIAGKEIIPEGVDEVGFYGTTYDVLHLRHKICDNAMMTTKVDWEGVEPGVYLGSKCLCKIVFRGDEPITAREAKAPITRIRNERDISFYPIGNFNAVYAWNTALNAIEIIDDKPDIAYFNIDGDLLHKYQWMPADRDTDEEQYDKVAQNTGNVEDYLEDFENTMKNKGYTQNLDELKEILEEVLERQGV